MVQANVPNVMVYINVGIVEEQDLLILLAHVIFGNRSVAQIVEEQVFAKLAIFQEESPVSVVLQQVYIHFKTYSYEFQRTI